MAMRVNIYTFDNGRGKTILLASVPLDEITGPIRDLLGKFQVLALEVTER